MPVTPGGDGPRLKGWQRVALLRDLALAEMTVLEIAVKWGRSEGTMYAWKKNHAAEIDAIRADAANEFAGLWVAQKVNRVAVYQDDIEDLEESDEPGAIATKHKALRAVAEELGQLTQKQEIQASVVYQVEGVDPESMR
jgi:hypothetical protein